MSLKQNHSSKLQVPPNLLCLGTLGKADILSSICFDDKSVSTLEELAYLADLCLTSQHGHLADISVHLCLRQAESIVFMAASGKEQFRPN